MKKQEKCFRSTLIVINNSISIDDIKLPYKKIECRLNKYVLLENEKVKDDLSK